MDTRHNEVPVLSQRFEKIDVTTVKQVKAPDGVHL